MLSVHELRSLATNMGLLEFERQLGPFVLVQRPHDLMVQRRAMEMASMRTTAKPTTNPQDAISLLFEFENLLIATLPPLAAMDALTLGRMPDCDIVVDDPSVSKHHAKLSWNEEAHSATVEDLGSSNGSELNGHALRKPTVLRDGDTLCFGDTRYCYLLTSTLYTRLKGR